MIPSYKIAVCGDGGVGKTTYLARLQGKGFIKKYEATMGVEIRKLLLDTPTGKVNLVFWDMAGQQRYEGLGTGYLIGAKAAIFMFDSSAEASIERLIPKIRYFKSWYPKCPFVLVDNQHDQKISKKIGDCVTISVKDGDRLLQPLIPLLRMLLDNNAIDESNIKMLPSNLNI